MVSQDQRKAATRRAALAAASALFGAEGYAAVSMDAVCRRADIAKGGLYHHFPTKAALFEAVVAHTAAGVSAEIEARVPQAPPYLGALKSGMALFFQECAVGSARRILVEDGPAVLGPTRWRAIDQASFGGLARLALHAAVEAGEIDRQPVEPLATLLLGAATEAVLACGAAEEYSATAQAHLGALDRLIDGLGARDARGV
ncbi:MAG: helix-turn-helix domain-containing protein [Pseudomonadota bacterium]